MSKMKPSDKEKLVDLIDNIMDGVLKHHKAKQTPEITDLFFKEIQNSHINVYNGLLRLYEPQHINSMLGMMIKKKWDLTNDVRRKADFGALIKSYRTFTY